MKATERLCHTVDGRLVPENDPDAAFLAYAVGKEISAADQLLLQEQVAPAAEPDPGPPAEPGPETKPAAKAPTKPRQPAKK